MTNRVPQITNPEGSASRLPIFLFHFIAYLKLLWAVPYPGAKQKPTAIKDERPMRAYNVEINTGAGMRKIYVEAKDETEAHYTALAKYMKTYFNTRVYPAPFKNTGNNEQQGTHKK